MAGRSRTMELILKGDRKSMSRTLKRAQGDVDTFSQKVGRAAQAMRKALNVGVAAAGAAVVGLATKMITTGDQFDKMSKRTGISVEQLQRFQFAAEQSGSSIGVCREGRQADVEVPR